MGNREGVVKAWAVRRRIPKERWDRKFIASFKATPQQWSPEDMGEDEERMAYHPEGEEEDEEMKEYWETVRRKDEFLDECRRKWKEQGKTEEECKRMWPQAFADWRAKNPSWNHCRLESRLAAEFA